jgi:hypothetical protein
MPQKVHNRPRTDWREVFGVSLRVLEREEGKRKRNQKLGVTLILLMFSFCFSLLLSVIFSLPWKSSRFSRV